MKSQVNWGLGVTFCLILLGALLGFHYLSITPQIKFCEGTCIQHTLGNECQACAYNEEALNTWVSPLGTSSSNPFSSVEAYCNYPLRTIDGYSKQQSCQPISIIPKDCEYKGVTIARGGSACDGTTKVSCLSDGSGNLQFFYNHADCTSDNPPDPFDCIWVGACPESNPNCHCLPRELGEVCTENYMCKSYLCQNGVCSSNGCTEGQTKCCTSADNCNGEQWLLTCENGGWVQSLEVGKCGYTGTQESYCEDCDAFARNVFFGLIIKSYSCKAKPLVEWSQVDNPWINWLIKQYPSHVNYPQSYTMCFISIIRYGIIVPVFIFSLLILLNLLPDNFENLRKNKPAVWIVSIILAFLIAFLCFALFIIGILIFIGIVIFKIAIKR